MHALSEARDGRMGDIVATIQSEQDRIIRASDKGLLVVQGGPGTGKTAVSAPHRVSPVRPTASAWSARVSSWWGLRVCSCATLSRFFRPWVKPASYR